jgi:hypothetical protein
MHSVVSTSVATELDAEGKSNRDISISSLLCRSTQEDGHNLMTEIPAILFPAVKDPRIGELFESLLGLTR